MLTDDTIVVEEVDESMIDPDLPVQRSQHVTEPSNDVAAQVDLSSMHPTQNRQPVHVHELLYNDKLASIKGLAASTDHHPAVDRDAIVDADATPRTDHNDRQQKYMATSPSGTKRKSVDVSLQALSLEMQANSPKRARVS